IFLLKNLETRLRRGATERVSGVAVTVSQRFAFRNRAVEAREYFVLYDGHRQRQIASAQSLSQHHHVGNDRLMFAGKHFPGPPKTSHHFIDNKQRAASVAPVPNGGQRPWRPEFHPSRTLNQRLDHNRGDSRRFGGRNLFERFEVAHLDRWKIPGIEPDLKHGGRAESSRPGGIAMIAILKSDKLMAV